MAIVIRQPRGTVRSISPIADYAGVVARYAQTLLTAQEAEAQAELDLKLLAYRRGNLSGKDMRAYLEEKLSQVSKGTNKEVRLRETLADLEDSETKREVANLTAQLATGGLTDDEQVQIYEKMISLLSPGTTEYANAVEQLERAKKIRDENRVKTLLGRRRSALMEKYLPGGLTNQEELSIIQELKTLVEPGSELEQELIEEEAKLATAITREAQGRGETAARFQAQSQVEGLLTENEDIESDYQSGKITGYVRDQLLLQNWTEIDRVVQEAGGQIEGLTGRPAAEIGKLEQTIAAREAGEVLDVGVMDERTGEVAKIEPVGLDELTSDIFGRYQDYGVTFDPTTQSWKITDPVTNQPFYASSRQEATRMAASKGLKPRVNIFSSPLTFEQYELSTREGRPVFSKGGQEFETPPVEMKTLADLEKELAGGTAPAKVPGPKISPFPSRMTSEIAPEFFEKERARVAQTPLERLRTGFERMGISPKMPEIKFEMPEIRLPKFRMPEFIGPSLPAVRLPFTLPKPAGEMAPAQVAAPSAALKPGILGKIQRKVGGFLGRFI